MADDNKHTERFPVNLTEREALDALRLSTMQDMTVPEFIRSVLRTRMYGDIARLNAATQENK